MSANYGAIEHLNDMCGLTQAREHGKIIFKDARLAKPIEPRPDTVPVAVFLRRRTPRDVVDGEIVQRLKNSRSSFALAPTRGRQA